MLRRALSTVLLSVLAGCTVNASCGSKNLDIKKGEAELAASIEKQVKMPVKVVCPTGVKIKKDDVFDCKVTLAEATGVFRVTQTDDQGSIHYELVEDFILSDRIEAELVERVKASTGVTSKVSCGPRVRVSTPGTKFNCTATDQTGKNLEVEVSVTDPRASVSFKVLGGA